MKKNLQDGKIILLIMVFTLIVTIIVGGLVGYAGTQLKAHRQAVYREQALDLAEAGLELAIWKYNNQGGYNGNETNVSYGNGVYSVATTNLSGSAKLMKVDSYIPNAMSPIAHRTVQITLTLGTKNIGFNYAVQAGEGGFQMDNGSQITGNVYTNGPIAGVQAIITGDATSITSITGLTIGGNALANNLDTNTIGGNASAHTSIIDSTITGNASSVVFSKTNGGKCKVSGTTTYNSNSGCTFAGGTVTPNNNIPAIPDPITLPIPDEQITAWENEASTGTIYNSDQTINGTISVGPAKINGNLTVNGTLNVTGTIWVTGSITASNGSTIKLDPSYGALTGVLMAGTNGSSTNGAISVPNNGTLAGSGNAASYLLLLSEMNNQVSNAISISNNAVSTILYAGAGIVNISNNAQLREVTAYKIHLNNNVQLTSAAGLTTMTYPSQGNSNGWQVVSQTWQLLQ